MENDVNSSCKEMFEVSRKRNDERRTEDPQELENFIHTFFEREYDHEVITNTEPSYSDGEIAEETLAREQTQQDEVDNLLHLIPWVSRDAIEQYLMNVPNDPLRERGTMCLRYFYEQKDKAIDSLKRKIKEDAIKIMAVLRDVPYIDVMNKLLLFGNIQGRREAVVRLLLDERYNNDLSSTNVKTNPNKRKSKNDNSQDDNIKIKIRRKDSDVQVVSTVNTGTDNAEDNNKVMQQPQHQPHLLPVSRPSENIESPEAVTSPAPFSRPSMENCDKTSILKPDNALPPIGSSKPLSIELEADNSIDRGEEQQIEREAPQHLQDKPQPSTSAQTVVDVISTAAPSTSEKRNIDDRLVFRITDMFPDACPEYVRGLCEDKHFEEVSFIVENMLGVDYPKRVEEPKRPDSSELHLDPDEQYEELKEILPDADPTYLRRQCDEFAGDMEAFKEFVASAIEKRNYPTMKEYLRKQQLSAQQKQYTIEFKVEDFVKLFPEPQAVFEDANRTTNLDKESRHYVFTYMRNKYGRISVREINNAVKNMNNFRSCVATLDSLLNCGHRLRQRRKKIQLPDTIQNIPLLQDIAFHDHKDEILEYIAEKARREQHEKQEAIANGLIESCGCCFDEEVMPQDIFMCEKGCQFCRDCIRRSVEVAMGDGKTTIGCLGECQAEFGLFTLQVALPPKMFSKLAQKKAVAEVKAAGIEELENCPFCDFATIPAPEDKLFRCLNPDCMKESCRLCKEPNHVPFKCDEVEVDESVKARTYIEDKLTEALLRKCWKCGVKFFKEEGCNHMRCTCGAHMCYLCGKPVTNYEHFSNSNNPNKCPISSDTIAVNTNNVLTAAKASKAEVDVSKLKYDPTADLEKHLKRTGKKPRR